MSTVQIRVTRAIRYRGVPQAVGTVLDLPMLEAAEFARSPRAELIDPTDLARIDSAVAAANRRLHAEFGRASGVSLPQSW
jgi:hypothetical protein